jgi:GT2 family glycosyltransferase
MSRKRRRYVKSDVDIIIPVYNRFDLLEDCLHALPGAIGDIPYKVYIFDNGSKPEDADKYYSNLDSPITVIRSTQNVGFPKACNEAAKRGKSDLIFLLNDDIVLFPNSLKILIEDIKSDPKIGVLGMKLMFPSDHHDDPIRPEGKIQHVGMFTNIRADFVHTFVGWSADNPKPNAVRDAYAVTGAAFLTRRKIWLRIGGLFEGYGMGTFEDVDFCMSAREMGYKICVNTKAEGTHFTGATAQSENIPYNMLGNKMVFMSRWQGKLAYTDWKVL